MNINRYLLGCLCVCSFGTAIADGKIRIKSDLKEAYIYIDGNKRAMVGDGYTTITVSSGEHRIEIKKQINKSVIAEGSRQIFVGDNTETELNMVATRKAIINLNTIKRYPKLFSTYKYCMSNASDKTAIEKEWNEYILEPTFNDLLEYDKKDVDNIFVEYYLKTCSKSNPIFKTQNITLKDIYKTVAVMPKDSYLGFQFKGETLVGSLVNRIIFLPMGNTNLTSKERLLKAAGIELREVNGKIIVDNVVFSGYAENKKIDFDWEIANLYKIE